MWVLAVTGSSLGGDGSGGACCAVPGRAGLVRVSADGPAGTTRGEGEAAGPRGMVWIPAGTFRMGSTDGLARADESPVHRVTVEGFWIDVTEVTNEQFAEFVRATGYVTVAERAVDWEELKKQLEPGTPKPDEAVLQPGALVFTPPEKPVGLGDPSRWWRWVHGADWRHPGGPGTRIEGRGNEPVVQVSWLDAVAFARWAGKSLPSEEQWEFAARGGLEGKVNVWGDEPVDATRCNTWQGHFPDRNTAEDGYAGVAPVKSFAPNGYGLYDMAGNVWEWCADVYDAKAYARRAAVAADADRGARRGTGSGAEADAGAMRVQRGGSFLCNDAYCASYRPSARMASAPDTGSQHVGFRCVMTAEQWAARNADAGPGAGGARQAEPGGTNGAGGG